MRLEQVEPGMRLAKDVYDPHGTVLLRAGIQISERHIKAFKSWGIHEIPLEPEGGPPRPRTPDPAALAEIREMLDTQFSLSNLDHPAVRALYDICLERALGQR